MSSSAPSSTPPAHWESDVVLTDGATVHIRPIELTGCGAYASAVYRFEAELWLYEGEAAWHFITVPGDVSDDIEGRAAGHRRGFGSVRVRVTVGSTTWTTSVFPDKKRQAFILPVKKEVRREESIAAGDRVPVTLELIDS